MNPRRVVTLAMPCAEVVEVGGVLDIFHAVNQRLQQAKASDPGYVVEVLTRAQLYSRLEKHGIR
jgi:hypothetical protein